MTDSLIEIYYDKLMKTKTPNIILAGIFRELFNRDLKKSEWGQLGKFINLYGKFIVLEAFIRASINIGFDSSSPWGYFNSICLSISKENREYLDVLEDTRRIQKLTNDILEELNKPRNKIKYRKQDYLREN